MLGHQQVCEEAGQAKLRAQQRACGLLVQSAGRRVRHGRQGAEAYRRRPPTLVPDEEDHAGVGCCEEEAKVKRFHVKTSNRNRNLEERGTELSLKPRLH